MSPESPVMPASFRHMPPPTTVHSGGAIVASLERPVGGKQPLSGPKTFVFALATAGIGPLLYDRFVWQQQARGQRSRLWHLADYLAARGLPDHRDDADRCGPKLTGLVLLIAIAQAALLAWSLYTGRIRLTLWSHDPWFFAYVGLAVAGYLAIALDMLLHHHLVARVVRQFGLSETVPTALPTPKPPLFVGAVLALAVGWYWAIPAILGSGVLRKEVDKNGRKWSVDLAAGVRAQPDLLDGPPPRLHANIRQCQTPRCATDLSPTAKFCPQCGVQARKVTLVT